MNKNEKIDLFGDGVRIFLDYVLRQRKNNPEYKPHPVIRAFECALQAIESCEDGGCVMGVSQDGTENNIYEPYVVVLQKNGDGIEVKEIKNIKVGRNLPLDVMILIFRIQIQLDKIDGDTVNPQQMVDILNDIIPGNQFYALGDKWKEARELFLRRLEERKISLPKCDQTEKWAEELKQITRDTPWEDYSNGLRSLIGGSFDAKLESENAKMIITSPVNSKIEKYKVFDTATEFMIGKMSDYLKK